MCLLEGHMAGWRRARLPLQPTEAASNTLIGALTRMTHITSAIIAVTLLISVDAAAQQSSPKTSAQTLSLTVLSTMLTDPRGIGEWGFAAVVDVDGRRWLFDTGARPETVLAQRRGASRRPGLDHRCDPEPPSRRSHRRAGHDAQGAGREEPGRALAGARRGGHLQVAARQYRGGGQPDGRGESGVRGDRGPFHRARRPSRAPARRLAHWPGAANVSRSATGAAR